MIQTKNRAISPVFLRVYSSRLSSGMVTMLSSVERSAQLAASPWPLWWISARPSRTLAQGVAERIRRAPLKTGSKGKGRTSR